jgi:MFS family permease
MLALRSDIANKGRFISLAILFVSFGLLIFSISSIFLLSLFMLVIIGGGLVSFFATANSFIQLSAPDNMRGRAMSIYAFVFLGMMPIGNSVMGVLANSVGTKNAVSFSSIVCIVASMTFAMKMFRGGEIASSCETPRT